MCPEVIMDINKIAMPFQMQHEIYLINDEMTF